MTAPLQRENLSCLQDKVLSNHPLIGDPIKLLPYSGKPLKKLKWSPCKRQRDRSGTMIGKLMPFHWNLVTWSWLKLTPTRGGGKWRTDGWKNCMYYQVIEGVPFYLMKNQWTGCSQVLHWNWLFLITLTEGTPLCMVVQAKWARCTSTALEEQTPEESKTKEVPQSVNCLSLAQCQDRWDSSGMGEQETMCVHADISQSFLDR